MLLFIKIPLDKYIKSIYIATHKTSRKEKPMSLKEKIMKGSMHGMGKFYSLLHKLPGGDKIVRAYVKGLGRFIYYMPGSGASKQSSIDGVRQNLLDMADMMCFDLEVIDESITPDSFEFYVNECPYGYCREDQYEVCDAAMDMDREMFRHIGAELIVQDYITKGAPKCRILMKWIEK